MKVHITISVKFEEKVKSREEADKLYDKIMELLDGRNPDVAAEYFSAKVAAGNETDIEEISPVY